MSEPITVRITPVALGHLEAAAEFDGISHDDLVTRAVTLYRMVQQSQPRAAVRWIDTLDGKERIINRVK